MSAMTAAIEPKVTTRTIDRPRSAGRASFGGQHPGARHFSTAERTTEAVGAAQSQRSRLVSEQTSLLMRRKRLNPCSPPIPGGNHRAQQYPAEATQPAKLVLARVLPDAPGTPGQEKKTRPYQSKHHPGDVAHHWKVYPHGGQLSSDDFEASPHEPARTGKHCR
jgi:hypothetical protein